MTRKELADTHYIAPFLFLPRFDRPKSFKDEWKTVREWGKKTRGAHGMYRRVASGQSDEISGPNFRSVRGDIGSTPAPWQVHLVKRNCCRGVPIPLSVIG